MPYILPVNNFENGQFNAKLLVKIMCKLTDGISLFGWRTKWVYYELFL